MKIASMFVGGVKKVETSSGSCLLTGLEKRSVGKSLLQKDGFVGDANASPEHHTLDKAVHLFPSEYYSMLEEDLGMRLPHPTFGENIQTIGYQDFDAKVGDRLKIGEAVVEITQPTERCKTIGLCLRQPKILKALHYRGFCGCYAKVLEPGTIRNTDDIRLVHQVQHDWTISKLHYLMFHQTLNAEMYGSAMSLASLSDEWKRRLEILQERVRLGAPLSSNVDAGW